MATKTEAQPVKAEPVRQYQHLYSVAEAYRGSDVKQRRYEIDAARRALTAQPINQGGFNDPGRMAMQSQQAQLIAEKEEALRAVQALESDDLVRRYCAHLIGEQPVTGVTINGEPLARGGAAPSFAPGMNSAVIG